MVTVLLFKITRQVFETSFMGILKRGDLLELMCVP